MTRRLGITGAGGYIGRRLVTLARAAGWEVTTLGRGPAPFPGFPHLLFDLASPTRPAFTDAPDALIHLAADTTGRTAEAADIPAARVLACGLDPARTRLVFVSSQTAAPDSPTPYGRSKAAIEAVLGPAGAVIVRPGLVYGGKPAGLWGTLRGLVRALPILPDLRPAPPVQPIHVDDLCAGLLRVAGGAGKPGEVLRLAGPPVGMGDFLRAIASHDQHRLRVFLPVPAGLFLALAQGAAAVVPALGPRAAQLRSLVQLPPMQAEADLALLGLALRPLGAGIRGARRARLGEAALLLSHVTGQRPARRGLARYLRGAEQLGLPPLDSLPARWRLRLFAPTLAPAALQRFGLPADLGARMRLALGVAEGLPETAPAFLATGARSWPVAFLLLALDVTAELPFLLARVLGARR